jgi:hypothetical protein
MSFFDFVLGNLTNPGTNPSNIFRLSALFQDYLGVIAEQNFSTFGFESQVILGIRTTRTFCLIMGINSKLTLAWSWQSEN